MGVHPPPHAAPLPQGFRMFGPRGAGHSGVLQTWPRKQQRVDRTEQPGPGRSRDVEPSAAGEGQAASGTGAHRIRGETHILREYCESVLHSPEYYIHLKYNTLCNPLRNG